MNSLASMELMISFAGAMGSVAGISSVVSGKYSRIPVGDMWLIAENVSALFPFIMQFHDLSSSLTRISIMLFEVGEFAVEELLELHPCKSARMDAIRMNGRFFLPASVSLEIIFKDSQNN